MQGYREVGDDGDYCSTFQCLGCKEYFSIRSNMDKWKRCPICGNDWHLIACRKHHVPKWMWNKFKSNEIPYEYWDKLHVKQVFPKPIIEIEWKIVGHDRWSSCPYTGNCRVNAFDIWQRETQSKDNWWDMDYRLIWNGKVLLNKLVKKSFCCTLKETSQD